MATRMVECFVILMGFGGPLTLATNLLDLKCILNAFSYLYPSVNNDNWGTLTPPYALMVYTHLFNCLCWLDIFSYF